MKQINENKQRLFLDESRLNGNKKKLRLNESLPSLSIDKGLTSIDKLKSNPDIPIYLVGIISSGDKVNRNGRMYPWSILKKECERYFEEVVKEQLAYGECFSEGHKILTRDSGWVDFKDLKGSEFVATMNKETRNFEWQQPIRKIEYEYEGEMVRLHSSKIDTLVTPNHKFVVKGHKEKLRVLLASELIGAHSIPRLSVWKGNQEKSVTVKNEHGELTFDAKTFAEFMGWYISEGWFTWDIENGNYSSNISQSKEDSVQEITQCLTDLGLSFSIASNSSRKNITYTFRISNKCLAYYLKSLGKSQDKYIPQEIKELSPEYIESFIKTYIKGDGWGHPEKEFRSCATVSKRLAEDLLEVFQKTNTSGKITQREQYASYYTVENIETGETEEVIDIIYYTHKKYTDNKTQYQIINKRRDYRGTVLYLVSRLRKKTTEIKGAIRPREYYKGKVYCVEVPNNVIYVMNNGLPFWSHNCDHPEDSATPMLKNAALIIEDIWFKGKDVWAKVKVLNAFMPQNAPGLMVRGILLNQGGIGISSRALGSLDESVNYEYDVVDEDLEIACWDFVSNASNYGSEKLQLVNEGKKKKIKGLLTESECFGGVCGIKNPLTIKQQKLLTLTEAEQTYVNVLGVERFLQEYHKNK